MLSDVPGCSDRGLERLKRLDEGIVIGVARPIISSPVGADDRGEGAVAIER